MEARKGISHFWRSPGAALALSLAGLRPLSFDLAWIAIVLCGLPIILEAVIGLVTAFDIKADVGIAMGGIGSDIAVEAADIALVNDEIKDLPHLLALSRHMMGTIKINMSLSMALNFVAIVLAMTGLLNPVIGALVHNAGFGAGDNQFRTAAELEQAERRPSRIICLADFFCPACKAPEQ